VSRRRIYLMRHGAVSYFPGGVAVPPDEVALTDEGVRQAEAARDGLARVSFDRVIATNLRGLFMCLQHEARLMLAAGGGAIVNAASILGQVGFAGSAPYVASKHAIIGLTRCAALDYARSGIRVNAICPGGVDTAMMTRLTHALGSPDAVRGQLEAMHPMGRLATPEEIAAAVVFLCAPAASFVTGHALAADGGFLAQ